MMLKLDIEHFCKHFWQQKPMVIKGAFDHYTDPLDEHDLAGLAMEEELDSRIISRQGEHWDCQQGPFESFEKVCSGAWTLLVQGVECYVPKAQDLLTEFQFLPSWRIDDLMVSFSVEGAGVGPHLDQYDVFIIQGKGRRRWQVGNKGHYESVIPHPRVRQITPFEAIIDEVLEPGDVIYIPPGYPHNGVALEPCLNYSVGFRAANQTELLSSFTDYLLDNELGTERYSDPQIALRANHSEIKTTEVASFKQTMLNALQSEHFDAWLLQHCSRSKLDEEMYETDSISLDEVLHHINHGETIYKAPGVKTCFSSPAPEDTKVHFAVNSILFEDNIDQLSTLKTLLDSPDWRAKKKNNYSNCSLFIQNIHTLINEGFWTLDK